MAEINADVETILQLQSEKIAKLEQENSILMARLLTAGKMLDAAEENQKNAEKAPVTRARGDRR